MEDTSGAGRDCWPVVLCHARTGMPAGSTAWGPGTFLIGREVAGGRRVPAGNSPRVKNRDGEIFARFPE